MKLHIKERRPTLPAYPDGWMESDIKFLENNNDVAVALLDFCVRNDITQIPEAKCPKCGASMLLSKNSKLGCSFWSCYCGGSLPTAHTTEEERIKKENSDGAKQLKLFGTED